MDYKNKYLKYKSKYLELKGGNKCDTNFQNLMDFKLENKDYKIYQGSINESPCGLDDLYQKCKLYLDSLPKIQEFILWTYTDGALARLLNNYLLKDKNPNSFYESSHTFYTICSQIKWYYFYELDKIDLVNEDNIKVKQLFETILMLMWINFKKINKKIFDLDKTAPKENKMDDADKKILTQITSTINNASPKLTDSDKVNLIKNFFINYNDDYPLNFIINYIINNIEKLLLPKFIDLNLLVLTKILNDIRSSVEVMKYMKLEKYINKKL
jgi:hypothetical protein